MSTLILNRNFELPADGWFHIAPIGEFPHRKAGLVQVLDEEACRSIVTDFTNRSRKPDFPGVLIDYDHFSLDSARPSEAAGWITALEYRPPDAGDASIANSGLWARIRWTDSGEQAVRGGRYRFLSPVWDRADCSEAGAPDRVRPLRLTNAAVTNDPNLGGLRPLSNRQTPIPNQDPSRLRDFAGGSNQETPPVNDTLRKRLADFLGLPESASDEELSAAMDEILSAEELGEIENALATSARENTLLTNAYAELEREMAGVKHEAILNRVPEEAREFWRDQLAADPQKAQAALEKMLNRQPEAGPAPAAEPAARASRAAPPPAALHNRQTARPPLRRPGATTSTDAAANRILNRAQEIRAATGQTFLSAFRAAQQELCEA